MMREHTNLLFILTDQQRFDMLACYGNHAIETPVLNHFAATAVVFDEAYCCQPVCAPSRGTLMTGLWPHQHGVTNNWEQPLAPQHRSLPQLAADAGKPFDVTGYLGKWHLGNELIEDCGFDEVVTLPKRETQRSGAEAPYSYEEYFSELNLGVPHSKAPEEYSMPSFLAGRATDFIGRHQGQSWMLQVSFDQPHPPYRSCRDGTVDPDSLPVSDNFLVRPGEDQPDFLQGKIEGLLEKPVEGCDLTEEAGWRELMASYWGNISNVDKQIGRIFAALEETGQLDKTLIVFTSDHGEMMGSHMLLQKTVMFQEAIRVPLLIRLPGEETGARIFGPVSQIDLVPTVLDLLGCKAAGECLPGKSLAKVCETALSAGETSAEGHASLPVIEWHASRVKPVNIQACKVDARTIVTSKRERYTWYADGQEDFYNLESDPGELHNLAGDPAALTRIGELRRDIASWQQETADILPPLA